MSIILDGSKVSREDLEKLSLAIGVAVASFFQESYGFRLTLKWPNDLLFAGRKMGGILCEGTFSGDRLSHVIVGIGLNIHHAPSAEVDGVPAAVSLKEIVGELALRDPDFVNTLGQKLVSKIYHLLAVRGIQMLADQYPSYGVESGQVWFGQDGRTYLGGELSEKGELQLKPFDDNVVLKVSNGTSSYRWLYQGAQIPLVIADLGNTAIKIALFEDARESKDPILALHETYDGALVEMFAELRRTKISEAVMKYGGVIHAASVNPKMATKVISVAETAGFKMTMVPKRPLRVRYPFYRFEQIGIDRVALLEAVRARVPGAALVLGCGTAFTLDIMNEDGHHLGGYITPGLELQLSGLAEAGALLPRLDQPSFEESAQEFDMDHNFLGQNTRQAIERGILAGLGSLIEACQKKYRIENSHFFISGGLAPLFQPSFGGVHIPDAAIHGVREMVLGGSKICQ